MNEIFLDEDFDVEKTTEKINSIMSFSHKKDFAKSHLAKPKGKTFRENSRYITYAFLISDMQDEQIFLPLKSRTSSAEPQK